MSYYPGPQYSASPAGGSNPPAGYPPPASGAAQPSGPFGYHTSNGQQQSPYGSTYPSHTGNVQNQSAYPGGNYPGTSRPSDSVVDMSWSQAEIEEPGKTANKPHAPPAGYPGQSSASPWQPHQPHGATTHGVGPSHDAVAATAHERWNREVRKAFTWKVLLLVAVQLAVTAGITAIFYTVDTVRDYVLTNVWIVWASWGIGFAVLLVLVCGGNIRRKFPINHILWALFTFTMSVMVASITSYYSERTVIMALAVTCATVVGAFCVAAFTPLDLTKAGGFLIAALFGVIVMSFFGIFWQNKWYYFAISLISAVIFTAFLIYDLQLVMGGRKNELSPDEYVIASITIYLDIIQIFLNLLQVIGIASN